MLVVSTGLNLARMFGDKFLKEQDSRFSSEPYVSQAVRITPKHAPLLPLLLGNLCFPNASKVKLLL